MLYLEKAQSQSFRRKTFLARGIPNMENGDRICIFKNITSFIYDFIRMRCFWFFDFCIFYANLEFPVSYVPKKKALKKWEKITFQRKKSPYGVVLIDKLLFQADLTVGVWKKGPSYIWQYFEKFRPLEQVKIGPKRLKKATMYEKMNTNEKNS